MAARRLAVCLAFIAETFRKGRMPHHAKSLFAAALAVAMLAVQACAGEAASSDSALAPGKEAGLEMRYQVLDELEWVYEDTKVDPAGAKSASLSGCRGSRPGFQVVIEGLARGARPVVAVSGGGRAALPAPEVFALHAVPVEENSGWTGFTKWEPQMEAQVTRRAPFRVFDVVRPVDSPPIREEKLTVLLIQFPVALKASPGRKSGTVSITAGKDAAAIPVTLEVYAATLPERGTLKVTNWFSASNMATRHGLTPWSEEHWRMIEKYGRLMRRNRQNVFWLTHDFFGVEKVGASRWRFDFSKAVRLIKLYKGLGFEYIEGPHLGGAKEWGAAEILISFDRTLRPSSPEGYALLAQFLTEWRKLLKAHKWVDTYIQHLSDEPVEASRADYETLAAIVRKHFPEARIIDAVEFPNLAAGLDIWVPKNHDYDANMSVYDAYRAFGDEIWFYTCCVPGGPYMNRFLDFHLLRTRYLHWGNYLYDLPGYLHWGMNHYQSSQNPFEQSVVGHTGGTKLPAGDTHIVYPGTDGPWSSMRFEMMRAGIEDYELFKLAEARVGRERAMEILNECVQSFKSFSEDVPKFRATYRELLEAASAKPRKSK